jgi:hypothetical protein
MRADSCYNEIIFVPDIDRTIFHGDAEGPLIGALQFFIAQTRIGWIGYQLFELAPEFNPHFFRETIQLFNDIFGNNNISRQNLFWPLSRI